MGLLVAKTLTNATANPFLAGGAGSYNPVLALDVFLVQVSFNLVSVLSIPGHMVFLWAVTGYIDTTLGLPYSSCARENVQLPDLDSVGHVRELLQCQ